AFIRVSITAVGSLLTIRFWNSTSADVRQSENGFLSSKRESGFGFGLESVRTIAERYGGEARFFWNKTERVFDSIVSLSNLDNPK
ncbi:MAG: GHKL domain-containing protein, partial [Oscillospiraceae bacterium]|nr:GHKL domain-containing protein [Oscillospiraceae bacterium]